MARKTSTGEPQMPAKLAVPRNIAREQLQSRHAVGVSLHDRSLGTAQQLEDVAREFEKWSAYNEEMVRRMFDTDEYLAQYQNAYPMFGIDFDTPSLDEKIDRLKRKIQRKLDFLDSLAERIDLIDEAEGIHQGATDTANSSQKQPEITNDVFVVHGRDEEMKSIVARFLEKCRLHPIILSEQPDQGRTIIEKFEQSANVGFAVVLLSPDDVGGLTPESNAAPQLQPRARQNVILELGYFVGRLGRAGVCALKRGDVDLPSDFSGVVYTPFGSDEGWKIKLARELKAAGLAVDLNVALS